ncbi:hypothetical protein ACFYXH_01380 [Streptomyces sp. NPDC002730]|uniref:hypothetical protein n=1 Tax=Streptomyces sp. NPDC002730 TaxID=3364662 RepID=UPI00368EF392
MALYPEGIFTSGPLFQLVSLAARESDPLEWQVLRLNRAVRTEHWDAPWRRWMQPLASQLDYMAATFTDAFFAGCPQHAREAWATAAAPKTVPEFMTELAMLLRVADREWPPDYQEVPLARWEAEARFPMLRSLDTWAYDDEFDSFEEAFQDRIDHEHPYCDTDLVPIVAQAMEALALCAASEHFSKALQAHDATATPAALKVIVELGHAHMRSHHRA